MFDTKILYSTHPNNQPHNEIIKTVYDKWHSRLFDYGLPIHLFGTGSEGNAVYLKPQHTLIDIGIPYKRFQEYDPDFFLDVDYIMVTHHHGDHLNPGTLLKVLKNYPHIKVITTQFLLDYVLSEHYQPQYKKLVDASGNTVYNKDFQGNDLKSKPVYELDANFEKILEKLPWKDKFLAVSHRFLPATQMELKTHDNQTFLFAPLTVKHHDLLNMAVQIYQEDYDLRLLYASDLDNLSGTNVFTDCWGNLQHVTGLPPENKYNCIFLEANYDEEMLDLWTNEKIAALSHLPDGERENQEHNVRSRAKGNLRHISEQEAFNYIAEHLDENGVFIPLHASKTFGTLLQDV